MVQREPSPARYEYAPVVEVMYLDFLGVCFDQLLNQAAKLPFMTGGAARMG